MQLLSNIFCDALSKSDSQLSNSSLQWFVRESKADSKISSILELFILKSPLSFIRPREIKDNSLERDL